MSKSKLLKVLLVTSVIVALAITVCFGLVACKDKEEEHEHTYSTTWNSDATNHWHDATCEHKTEKSGLAKHDTNGTDGACSVCGYKAGTVTPPAHEHTLSGWVNTDPTEHYKTCTGNNCTEALGARIETGAHDTNGADGACSVCGYKATVNPPAHVHTPSEWTYVDGTEHYKTCTGANCTEVAGTKIETGAHDTDGTDGACSKCGYKAAPSHEHTFADGWTNDATGHWHAATCEHDTEIDGFAAHDTTGENGACSVCGYNVYATLLASENKIMDEKFDTAMDKLPEFDGTYGTAGIYMTGETAEHFVKVEGGKAVMVDPGAGETRLVIDLGLVSGTIEGYLEVTIDGATNNSWTFLRLANGKTEKFALRTDGGNIKYRLDGGSNVATPNSTIAFSKTTYKVYFKFDGATKKLTMMIDGKDFVKGLELSDSEINAILLVSGGGHVGVAHLDNLVIVNDIALADLKTVATTKLQEVYATYDLATNYTANGADVTAAKDTGVAAIADATTKAEIVTAYNTAVAAMKAVETDAQIAAAQALATAKQEALAELNAHKGGANNFTVEGDDGNKTAYDAAIANGTAAINAATTTDDVATALQAAKDVIDGIYTDEQLVATKYTVTFVNSPVADKEVADGDKVDRPANPTDADAVFVNWYSNEACTTEFDFNTPITANTKIYAKWEGKLLVNGTPVSVSATDFDYSSETKIAAGETVEKNGFTFYEGMIFKVNKNNVVTGVNSGGSSQNKAGSFRVIVFTLSAPSKITLTEWAGKTAGSAVVGVYSFNKTNPNPNYAYSASETALVTLDCKNSSTNTITSDVLPAGDYIIKFSASYNLYSIVITPVTDMYFTGITGTPTTTTYDAVPTAETVDLAGLALAVKGSESGETIALTADSVKAKVSAVVNAPENEEGSYSITVKYGNYVTYTYDITVTADAAEEA